MHQSGTLAAVAAALVTVFGYAVHRMASGRPLRERLVLIPAVWVPFGMVAALAASDVVRGGKEDAASNKEARERAVARRFAELVAYEKERSQRQ